MQRIHINDVGVLGLYCIRHWMHFVFRKRVTEELCVWKVALLQPSEQIKGNWSLVSISTSLRNRESKNSEIWVLKQFSRPTFAGTRVQFSTDRKESRRRNYEVASARCKKRV